MTMRLPAALLVLLSGVVLPALSADPPPVLPSELDALDLADKAPIETAKPAQPLRMFVEGGFGQGSLRRAGGADDSFDTARGSFDLRYDTMLAPGVRAIVSNRLDLVDSHGVPRGRNLNTLREAYVSWARTPQQTLEVGRINIRHGAAFGFNPTDWFKENALRTIVSPDPAVLRENRQGTFVLQGQQLWNRGAVTAAFSPDLGDRPSDSTFTLNTGATNPRNRWLLAGSYKFGDRFAPQLLLFGGADMDTQLGLNASTLLGDATVAFGEFAIGKGRALVAQSLNRNGQKETQQRAALGLTYTTGFNLSLTAEAEYNSAAPDRAAWDKLRATDPAAPLALLGTAQALQDLPTRRAWFVHGTWKDAFVRRLDLSAFMRHDAETSSRAQWLELRYHWPRVEMALQWLLYSGRDDSVYGSVPQRRAVELALRFYL